MNPPRATESATGQPLPASPAEPTPRPARRGGTAVDSRVHRPSSLYRAETWRAGVTLARRLPHFLLGRLAMQVARAYWFTNRQRRRVVQQNLLPALAYDERAARITCRELFEQFALKLTDLWRYESGLSIYNLFHELTGWEHFLAAQNRGRGVLILTIHLGNWEFGAPVLTQRGIKLQVITLAEPHAPLTQLRQAARARWGIETLALTADPFASLEIIRTLESQHAVALLMDRPPPGSATIVRLFGRPFAASVAAAELARATGCALLPVYIPRTHGGYHGCILPELPYERRDLRSLTARTELTQRIMSAFEPALRLYLNQWYHFVPIWPDPPTGHEPDVNQP